MSTQQNKNGVATPTLEQAVAVIVSVMRFGTTTGIKEPDGTDYFKENRVKDGTKNGINELYYYIEEQSGLIFADFEHLFNSSCTPKQLQKAIKGE